MPAIKPATTPQATQLPPDAQLLNYFCDSCSQSIPGTLPRVNCLTCVDHDLCANCALGERFSGTHTAAHPTQVFRVGGDASLAPIVSDAAVVYGGARGTKHASLTTAGDPIVSSAPTSWDPFFDANLTPSPVFLALMEALFQHLDSEDTGLLAPETYSKLLDDMGIPFGENFWKCRVLRPTSSILHGGSSSRETPADAALKLLYDKLEIEHTMYARRVPGGGGAWINHERDVVNAGKSNPDDFRAAPEPPRSRPDGNTFTFLPSTPDPTPTPMLTLRGFIEITAFELLASPSTMVERLSRVVSIYGLYDDTSKGWYGWGPIPRSVLPADADARVVQKMCEAIDGLALDAKSRGMWTERNELLALRTALYTPQRT